MRLCGHRRDKTCEQRCGAMAFIVMRASLHLPGTHRQQRLGAVQRLDLAFLIDADDQRLVRRIQIKPHDIAYFLDELRIGRKFERFGAMRLQ
jgi:hypothetical protein